MANRSRSKMQSSTLPVAEPEIYKKDLNKCTRVELVEMRNRQVRLLKNKNTLKCLADKGKRIQDFYDKVIAELLRRDDIDEAAAMFSKLNIPETGQKALEQMEWHGRATEEELLQAIEPLEEVLDSDDESEMEPLRILAQPNRHERRVKELRLTESLLTAHDLSEIESFKQLSPSSSVRPEPSVGPDSGIGSRASVVPESSDGPDEGAANNETNAIIFEINLSAQLKSNLQRIAGTDTTSEKCESIDGLESTPPLDPHVHYLVGITETTALQQREKFKPYQTTITNVHDPAKERVRKHGKHWEITAATPPLIQHNCTQTVTLLDSVEIQMNYLAKLKVLQEQQAAERLAAREERMKQRKMGLPPDWVEHKNKPSFTVYREMAAKHIEGDQKYCEHDEVHDPLDVDSPGGVLVTMDDWRK